MTKLLYKRHKKKDNVRATLDPDIMDWLRHASRSSGYSISAILEMAVSEFAKKVKLPEAESDTEGGQKNNVNDTGNSSTM